MIRPFSAGGDDESRLEPEVDTDMDFLMSGGFSFGYKLNIPVSSGGDHVLFSSDAFNRGQSLNIRTTNNKGNGTVKLTVREEPVYLSDGVTLLEDQILADNILPETEPVYLVGTVDLDNNSARIIVNGVSYNNLVCGNTRNMLYNPAVFGRSNSNGFRYSANSIEKAIMTNGSLSDTRLDLLDLFVRDEYNV